LIHDYPIAKRKINFCRAFAGQYVGVAEVENMIWLVSLMDYALGLFDDEVNPIEPADKNPFIPKVLPMCPEWTGLISRFC
jgi:hypothetical protein